MEGSHTFTLHPFYPATQGSFSRRPPRMVSAAYVLEEKASYNHEYDKNKNGFESYSQRVQKLGASKGEGFLPSFKTWSESLQKACISIVK